MYLGVIFDRKMTCRLHIEMTVPKALGTFIRAYSLFKNERLSTNIKLILYKTLIRPIMIYAWPTWKYAVDADLWKLQHLQTSSLRCW
jgi:hypothetical protein